MGNTLMKLARRNRSNEPSSSPIFKLNNHCFDELFDYLSLMDLHSFGQTCKSMQQMTGHFFKLNYSAANIVCLADSIYMIYNDYNGNPKCIPIQGFIQFITSISIGNNIVKNVEEKRNGHIVLSYRAIFPNDLAIELNYIKLHAHELQLVKKLYLTNVDLNPKNVNCILKILPNIEVLELGYSEVNHDFYDIFLKYCKNLRRLHLTRVNFENNYKWLLQRYEKLEHLDLSVGEKSDRIDELVTFFEYNPNLRSFSCDSYILWPSKDILLNSKVKLDTFEFKHIWYKGCKWEEWENTDLWNFLHQLHKNGFYKRLHINDDSDIRCDPVAPFLEKLFIISLGRKNSLELVSTQLIGCNEFNLIRYVEEEPKNGLLVQNLMNMECLYLNRQSADILLFIQQLKNLKKLKLINFKTEEILKLDLLNAEREKLFGARKITIYVPDAIYLATKWATKNGATNFNLIEMKRIDSDERNRSIYDYGWRMPNAYFQKIKKKNNSQIITLFNHL